MNKKKKITFTIEDFDKALPIADKLMKNKNGHEFETILKTRCIHCGRKPLVKTKCSHWFQTFISRLRLVLMNKEIYFQETKNGNP